MSINKFVTTLLLCLLIISCGGSGKNRKREPSRRSKKEVEVVEKKRTSTNNEKTDEESDERLQRNNGNHRKSSQRERGVSKRRKQEEIKPVQKDEEDPAIAKAARIEKRVQLELDIWKANKNGDSGLAEKLRKDADELEKEMRQPELDEVYKKIKDIKKRM